MAFVKLVKNKAYFKRFQVKYRRRREGKTDYKARRRFCTQSKNKYNSPKYRFVCRVTSTKIICQIIYATIQGDRVVADASSSELKNYGVETGLTNYPAAYCTGLLLARRLLKTIGMDRTVTGVKEATGEEYHVEEENEDRRPFKALLDVGIVRTTVGNRVFGAMKGACDGGIHIPHSTSCFAGFVKGDGEGEYDAAKHRERIMGVHVANYMKTMKVESPEKFEAHFSRLIAKGINGDNLEEMYKKAHVGIRSNPDRVKKVKKAESVNIRQGQIIKTAKGQYTRMLKITLAERKERVQKKIQISAQKMAEANA